MSTSSTFRYDDSAAQAMLGRLRAAGQNLRPMLDALVFTLTERVRLSFHDQADPWGMPWVPLSDVTLARRRDEGRSGASILRDKGELLASLSGVAHANAADIRLGFADRPATIHLFGGKAGRGRKVTIPARPMMPIRPGGRVDMPPVWRDEVLGAMTAHLNRAIAA